MHPLAVLRSALPSIAIIVVVLSTLPSPDARAEQLAVTETSPAGAEPVPRAEPDWALSAGVVFIVPGVSLAGSTGGLGGLRSNPPVLPGLSAQYRLTGRLWLVARLSGGYAETHSAGLGSTSWAITGGTGLRVVFTSRDAIVDISGTAAVNVTRAGSRSQVDLDGTTESRSTSVEAALGLSVARELVDGLSLAASVKVLSVSWARSSFAMPAEGGDGAMTTASDSIALAMPLTPSLDLRYEF